MALVLGLPLLSAVSTPPLVLDAALDPALRVPFSATFLRPGSASLRPGDRVMATRLSPDGIWDAPADRIALLRGLQTLYDGAEIQLQVLRGEQARMVALPVLRLSPRERLAANWPILLLGLAYLGFGLVVLAGSRHPVALPVFAVCFSVGACLVALLDLVIPTTAGLASLGEARARIGLLALAAIPASLMHLAMRFPVVSKRFESPRFSLVPYAFWLVLAVAAQLQLDDGAMLQTAESILIGATFLTAALLVLASLLEVPGMRPIERGRAYALTVGIAASAPAPLYLFLTTDGRPAAAGALLLPALAFPLALGWAVVRYRLLDPPLWVRETLLSGMTMILALLLAIGALSATMKRWGDFQGTAPTEAVALVLLTTLVYQIFRSAILRTARASVIDEDARGRLLEEANRCLASAVSPEAVVGVSSDLIRRHLMAAAVEGQRMPVAPGADLSLLRARALDLWRGAGAPTTGVVVRRLRGDDPDPDRPEVVIPLAPANGPSFLIGVASRTDALPYSDDQIQDLESLALITTTALGSAVSKAELDALVREKTRALGRNLEDRERILRAAHAICEADEPFRLRAAVLEFLQPWSQAVAWRDTEPEDATDLLIARVGPAHSATSWLTAEIPDVTRRVELRPQLETVCVFAELALARLQLLADLKDEVEEQARELSSVNARRLHAEFVRDVAHELRKPTDEVHKLAARLRSARDQNAGETLARIHRAAADMARRLDLLLFHSGVRIDRRRIDLAHILRGGVERAQSLHPDRTFEVVFLPELFPMVGDPTRLGSLIENLLDNAAKATGPGGCIRMRARLERAGSRSRGPWVRVEIEDDGPGIDPAHIPRIFEPGVSFAQGGFGLGLSLCREIVRMHGGQIDVQSEPGRTIFSVRLPRFGEAHPTLESS
jgi:signal transduction histidine kinase